MSRPSSKKRALGRPREVADEDILSVARRWFLKQGAGVSAVTIAEELGVSHTTIFNRFGSKEDLMIAALGPPNKLPWAHKLESGPDERPIVEQLIEISRIASKYFEYIAAGFQVLRAAGITHERVFRGREEPTPVQAFKAVSSWLRRAQDSGRMRTCDVDTLTATLLGAWQGWAFTARMCGRQLTGVSKEHFVEEFVDLIWRGIAPDRPQRKG